MARPHFVCRWSAWQSSSSGGRRAWNSVTKRGAAAEFFLLSAFEPVTAISGAESAIWRNAGIDPWWKTSRFLLEICSKRTRACALKPFLFSFSTAHLAAADYRGWQIQQPPLFFLCFGMISTRKRFAFQRCLRGNRGIRAS